MKNRLTETEILQRRIRSQLILTIVFMVIGIGSCIGKFNSEGMLSITLGTSAMISAVVAGFFAISAWRGLMGFVKF